jgi:thiamine-phosphate pyrophosphorylase
VSEAAPPSPAAAAAVPVIHAVTTDDIAGASDFAERARGVMRALGARGALHLRAPSMGGRALHALAASLVDAAHASGCALVVNDRLDVALAAGADGVHLRGDSMPSAAARRLAPRPFLIGRSVHGVEEARAAGADVDFLIAGTVFPTASKPPGDLLGIHGLRRLCGASGVPVLAIGGIGPDQLDAVAAAGAAGIAGIGWFDGRTPLAGIVEAVRRRFDTPRRPSYHTEIPTS